MTAGEWWHHLSVWAARQGQPPSHVLVLGTGLLAAAAVASRRVWPVARTVVTIAHEGGHALAAVATGRRLHSVRVLHSSAGVTVSEGSPAGPGIILTALAGYLRNAYGVLAVGLTAAGIVAVLWRGAALPEALLGYVMTWFLLFGGLRPVLELQRGRRRRPRTSNDADQLARLTGLPGGLWVGVFALVAVGALALGGWLLIR